MSLPRTLLEGVIFQPRIILWALARPHRARPLVVIEVILAISLFTLCFALLPITPIFAVYAILMIMGSWGHPADHVLHPHNSAGRTTLAQTRLFRGKVLSVIALDHLYHLEHHLYPAVPHHNWPRLAKRLDPYFQSAGVEPHVLGF